MSSKELRHNALGKSPGVGRLVIVRQSDGWYIHTTPRTYIDAYELEALKFWLDAYKPKIGTGGDVRVVVPKNRDYGHVVREIARAYYLIQRGGVYPMMPTQTQVSREA